MKQRRNRVQAPAGLTPEQEAEFFRARRSARQARYRAERRARKEAEAPHRLRPQRPPAKAPKRRARATCEDCARPFVAGQRGYIRCQPCRRHMRGEVVIYDERLGIDRRHEPRFAHLRGRPTFGVNEFAPVGVDETLQAISAAS